jgi:hypothetical protein
MRTRTTGAIAMKPTGNAQGGHWFYSLTTGRMLDRQQWRALPMPADVIERINVLAKASQVGMNFTNMCNEVYDDFGDDDSTYDFNEDSDYGSDDESSDGDDDDYDDFIAGVDINTPPDRLDNKPNGIPTVATPQESRSVLESDIVNGRSPRSLTVLHACDTPTGPTGTPTGQPARRASTRITNDDSAAPKASKPDRV